MFAHNFILGGVTVAFDAAHQINQDYEPLAGAAVLRLSSGAAVKQTAWDGKLRTTLSGSGRLPPGLDGLDYSASLSLSCMAPRSLWAAATTGLSLPASRRTDWAPHGYAIVNGRQMPTAISIVVNAVTFTAVAGASGYVCAYYPTLTVFASAPRLRFDGRGPVSGWEIIAEEI